MSHMFRCPRAMMTECACGCGILLTGRQKKWADGCQKREVRNAYLLSHYGISQAQYDQLLDYQGGKCAVCGKEPKGQRKLVVDHEHAGGPAGKVRGLICNIPCNLRIVAKHKSPDILQAAADYLRQPPAVALWGEIIAPGRPRKKRRRRR
jgi:Recombination endonuclease VII